jgi:Ni/Fe-hydrogenase 1 B-type cytochrome subunit
MVWSGWLRLSHAATGLSTLALLLTGWLIADSPSLADDAVEAHYLAASVLVFGLLIRLALFALGQEHERLHHLVPRGSEVSAVIQTLRNYVSFGKLPLPGWYAQNPLWKPLYLVMYLGLVVLAASGALMPDTDLVYGFYLPSVHAWWAWLVLWFSGLHLVAVVWHDLAKGSTDVSAIINGYRTFEIDTRSPETQDIVQVVTIDSLKKNN